MDKTTLLKDHISLDSFDNVRTKWIQYNLEGHNNLGSEHNITELEWKDYCPEAFRNIQELDDISQVDYSMLLCSSDILREVTLPGKTGHTFLLSHDVRLGVKTLRKIELKAILDMFRSYYYYLSKNPTSLLVKLYGLHSVRQCGGLNVYFVVFGNPAQVEASCSECYHLKGISTGRKHNIMKLEDYVLHKDFEFGYRFYLHQTIREKLLQQMKTDCEYLEAEGRMDYCLALVVAFPTSNESPCSTRSRRNSGSSSSSSCKSFDNDCSSSPDTPLKIHHETTIDINSNEYVFGRGMPAIAVRKRTRESQSPERLNVVLYFEIMEIFQKYNIMKRMEHLYKTIHYDTHSVSTINPKEYSSRFLEFTQQIFLPVG